MKLSASHRKVRLKYLAHIEMGQSPPSTDYVNSSDEGLPFLQGTADFGHTTPIPKVYCISPLKIANSGDILLSVRAPVGELNIADQKVGIGRGLCAIRLKNSWHPRFGWWALHEARYQFASVSSGITYEAIVNDDVANLLVEDCDIKEQRAIADFLDQESAQIDALISAKERLLVLLEEKRRAVITKAVTLGLNPNVPLRNSGIPWIDKIPAHWETFRLRFISPQITVGIVVTPAKYYEASGIPCLRSLNVRETGLQDSDLVYISEESNALLSKSKIYTDDLVVVRTGQPGTAAVVDRRFDGANCIDLIIVRKSTTFDSTFMAHYLNSDSTKIQFLMGSGGAIQQHFNVETVSDLIVLLPPLNEQRAIVKYISQEIAKLDVVRYATEKTITLLKERRSALITEAVSGQITMSGTV